MNGLTPINYDNHKDFLGNRIRIGQLVVYPGRVGSSLWMTKARVTGLAFRNSWNEKDRPTIKVQRLNPNGSENGKAVTLSELDRVTVVPGL